MRKDAPGAATDALLALLLDAAPDAVVCVDLDGRIVFINEQVERVFGWSRAELTGRLVEVLVPAGFREAHVAHRAVYAADPIPRAMGSGLQLAAVRRDGSGLPVDISLSAVEVGGRLLVLAAIRDVTERVRARAALDAAEQRFSSAFRNALTGMALTDEAGRVVLVNDALAVMVGRDAPSLDGVLLADLAHAEDRPVLVGAVEDLSARRVEACRGELRLLDQHGEPVWAALSMARAEDTDGAPRTFVVELEDVSDRHRAMDALAHETLHDPLTGLPNRVLLADRITQALSRRPGAGLVALFYVDVDRFKDVNTVHGHEVGDMVLRDLAKRLSAAIRPSDTLARLGGDEFVVLVDDVGDVTQAKVVAERLRAAVATPSPNSLDLPLSVSVGIALSKEGVNPAGLLRGADAAMYLAKQRGKNRFALYDEALEAQAANRLATERLVHDALNDSGVITHYQPMLDIGTGRIVAVEALARLKNGGRLLLPGAFIAVAEETGQIVPLGARVLTAACRQERDWLDRLGPDAPAQVAVNLSTRQVIQQDIVETVATALTDARLEPSHLALEITETALMEATESVIKTIDRLRELGVSVGLDDFGTGFASLTYLRRLALDFVKVDGSFVADMTEDSTAAAIVRSVIDLGHALGLATIGEGVERQDQLDALRASGCEQVQGFLFAGPGQPPELESLMHAVPLRQ